MDKELSVFSSMTKTVKKVATTIKKIKHVDIQPSLYSSVMDMGGFNQEALRHRVLGLLAGGKYGY